MLAFLIYIRFIFITEHKNENLRYSRPTSTSPHTEESLVFADIKGTTWDDINFRDFIIFRVFRFLQLFLPIFL